MDWRSALAVVLIAIPSMAHAQLRCEDAGRARTLFERGRRAMAAEQVEQARDHYRESYSLCPRIPTAFNLASTCLSTGRPAEAVELLESLRAGALGALAPPQREVVDGLLEGARPRVGRLQVSVHGASHATVVLDERPAREIEERASETWYVDPGTHRIRARSDDGRRTELELEAIAGSTRELVLTLPALEGRLVVTAEDANATVEILGVGAARGRLVRQLPPAQYIVRGLGQEEQIDLRARSTERVHFEPGENLFESPWFWLVVGALVVGAAATTTGILLSMPQVEEDPVWGRVGGS